MLRVGALLTGVVIFCLAGCGPLGISTAQSPTAVSPSYTAPRAHRDLGFGCPGGHLLDSGGAMAFSAAPFKGSIGYAPNSGGVCAHVSASTRNIYNAPPPPSGWSALVYVEIKMADRHGGRWKRAHQHHFIGTRGKNALSTSAYYCARWFVADGTQWNDTWTSQTAHATSDKRLRLAGTSPDYTPYFNSSFVLKAETILEILEPPANDRC